MMDTCISRLVVAAFLATICFSLLKLGEAIDCFECYSLQGNQRDCEDEFGPQNKTAHLVTRNCKVGYLRFKANYCVKIKGTKENGQTVVIRTCSMEDWGTQCGDIFFEQGRMRESLTGCLATCPFDGCNSANPTGYFMRKVPFSPYLPTFLLRSNPLMLICLITSTLLTTGTSFKFSDLCGNFLLGHT